MNIAPLKLTVLIAAALSMASHASMAADAVTPLKKTNTVKAKKVSPKKTVVKKTGPKKTGSTAIKTQAPSKANPPVAVPTPQNDELIALAARFTNGNYGCEFNEKVTIEKRLDQSGIVNLTHKGVTTPMTPVATNTGALRLENKSKGLMWLQLPTKSMLMNSKIGQRMADDCQAG